MNNRNNATEPRPPFHAGHRGVLEYDGAMAGENRRVAAASVAHAQGLADNLMKQGFAIETRATDHWVLRKKRLLGDHVVTIAISRPTMLPSPPPTPPQQPGTWAPPRT